MYGKMDRNFDIWKEENCWFLIHKNKSSLDSFWMRTYSIQRVSLSLYLYRNHNDILVRRNIEHNPWYI